MLTSNGAVAAEIQREIKKVGLAKSGWKLAAEKLRVKLPAWVMRHDGEGYFLARKTGSVPFIEFANEVDYAGKNALEDRVMEMSRAFALKQFEKSIAYYWGQVMAGKGAALRAKLQKDTFEVVAV
jgi:hypothetical protein